MVGINAIIPIFSVIEGGEATDILSRVTFKFFTYTGLSFTVKHLMIFMALMFILKALLLFASKQIGVRMAADYEKNSRSDLFKAMTESFWPYLAKQKAGYLDQILTTDVSRGSALLVHLGGSALIVTNLVVYSLLALNISFVIAFLAFVTGGVFLFALRPLFYKNVVASKEAAQKHKDLAHYTNEIISGMKAIKSAGLENHILKRSLEYFSSMKALYLRVGFLKNISAVILQPISAFFVLGIFAFFYKTNTLHFASFAVIIYAINRVFSNIQAAESEMHILSSSAPHVMSILAYKEEAVFNKEIDKGTEPFKFNKSLEFKNVSFSYDGSLKTLSDISFSISCASLTGIIGPSGSGKTTLVDLLLRLYEPQKGSILIDGEDVAGISLRYWRNNIVYVPQDAFLMNDTIKENIKFYNEGLNDADIIKASQLANIYYFIESLPKKFDTIIGERGIRLSGGERQRIVLARALAKRPQILILDEATSSLDSESESLIQEAVEKLKRHMTIIVIAHRLSTVVNSDKLIVLEMGRILETGTPEEMLQDKESYFFKAYNLKK